MAKKKETWQEFLKRTKRAEKNERKKEGTAGNSDEIMYRELDEKMAANPRTRDDD